MKRLLKKERMNNLESPIQNIQSVLALYPVKVHNISLLEHVNGSTKWLLDTTDGLKMLKKLKIKPERMLFIAGAHDYLVEKGFPIETIQLTTNGGLCIGAGNESYIMYDFQNGNELHYYNKDHLLKIMHLLGKFHDASKGYIPPINSKKRTKIGKLEKVYRWSIQELEGNKLIAQSNEDDPFWKLYLEYVDSFLIQAKESLNALNQPAYLNTMEQFKLDKGFCFQSITLSKFNEYKGQPFMRDLGSITFDLPTRDLRILLNKTMSKLGVWDSKLALEMLQTYDKAHPLSNDYYQVLWNDLRFPYLFCSISNKYFSGHHPTWTLEKYIIQFKNAIEVEKSKESFLQQHSDNISFIKYKGEVL